MKSSMSDSVEYEDIGVIAPHDRINFGDFLFAIILDHCFKKKTNSEIILKKYSIVSSDFSHLGAFKSSSYKKMAFDINNGKLNHIIIGGGESLAGKWDNIFSYINPFIYFLTWKMKFYKFPFYSKFLGRLLGGKSEHPFNINKEDFNNTNLKVYYNSIGSGFLTNEGYAFLKKADYIAVRDQRSFDNLKSRNQNLKLVPDSAIILSDIYNEDKLKENNRFIKIDFKYVFFQISPYKIDNKYNEISKELEKILVSFPEIKIVLCPIGTAEGHKDNVGLLRIKDLIKNQDRVEFIDNPTIEEIIFLIQHSATYIGTSLHGMITAMSYGIPYILLNKRQRKIVSYMATWSIPELNKVTEFDEIADFYKWIQSQDLVDLILLQSQKHKELYYKSFDKIYNIIVSS